MRIGIGCTALARSRISGHADGIGVYTGELLKHYAMAGVSPPPLPVVFGKRLGAAMPDALALPLLYSISAAGSAFTGLPFAGSASLEPRIDLFHATDHHIPKLRRVPVVATIMDVIGLRHPEWVNPSLRRLKNHVFRRATGWAQRIVTISDFSAADISDCLGIPAEKIVSIPLGVDEAFFREVPAVEKATALSHYGLAPGYFLFVGTLQPRKNVVRLIQAHKLLPAAVRREHPLVIVGQDGWRTDELLPMLAELEASQCGRWLKYVPREHLFALLQSAHALVFPSLYEGFGLPVLEAFASRVPVITSSTTSLPEVAGDAALLVDPLSVEHIAHAMTQVLEEGPARAAMVAGGYARAREFTWQKTARKTRDAYAALT